MSNTHKKLQRVITWGSDNISVNIYIPKSYIDKVPNSIERIFQFIFPNDNVAIAIIKK